MARKKKCGFSFSWKRAIGLSSAKPKLSRQLDIPLTKSGRQRKMGRAMGCCIPMIAIAGTTFLLLYSLGTLVAVVLT